MGLACLREKIPMGLADNDVPQNPFVDHHFSPQSGG